MQVLDINDRDFRGLRELLMEGRDRLGLKPMMAMVSEILSKCGSYHVR